MLSSPGSFLRLQARTLAVLWCIGSGLAVIVGILPSDIGVGWIALAITTATAVVIPLILAKGWHELPPWIYHALIISAASILGFGLIAGRGSETAIGAGMLFVWLALYVFFFFSNVAALCHLALFEVVIAGTLLITESPESRIQTTLLAATVAGSGFVTGFLIRQLRRTSRIDPLTGLPNREALGEILTREIANSFRYKTPLAVAYIDIDFFKDINDTHGHLTGDMVLCQLSEEWYMNIRNTDVIGRLGGDEFLVILPHLSAIDAFKVLERARSNCSYSCSVGVSFYRFGDSALDLINRADQALYIAKRSGRSKLNIEVPKTPTI